MGSWAVESFGPAGPSELWTRWAQDLARELGGAPAIFSTTILVMLKWDRFVLLTLFVSPSRRSSQTGVVAH